MNNPIIIYGMIVILLTVTSIQHLTIASPKEEANNQTFKGGIANPELHPKGNITHSQPELAPVPEEPPAGDVVHCAALGCPGNPPNPHGPPTEEPQSSTTDGSEETK
jgi:hypothetical protein